MPVKRCFVLNCENDENSGEPLHHFPRVGKTNVLRCRFWAQFCQPNSNWSEEKTLQKLFTSHKYICARHFKADAYCQVNPSKLTNHSVPSINPPLVPSPCSPELPVTVPSNNPPVVPSPNSPALPHCTLKIKPHNETVLPRTPITPPSVTDEPFICDTPKTSREPNTSVAGEPFICQTPKTSRTPNTAYESASTKTPSRNRLLTKLHVTRTAQLSPRKQWLVKSHKKTQKEYARVRKEYKELKDKTEANILELSVFKKLPPALKMLLASTIRCAERNPQGRRWTVPDKIQALSLFKNSPRNYNFLRKLFPLPCPRTLRTLLGSIPFTTGVCKPVLNALKIKLENLDPKDRFVTLMFDEMSIRRHLSYNRKLDKIEGYQDHKGQGYSGKVANHALVFMVQGLRRRMKQPVAYYFSSSQTSSDRLVIFLRQVIRACEEAGLRVISTVCDMGSNNVKALKNLGVTETAPYFHLDGKRIYTIYDPCHLLKCTRNNFMKKNLQLRGTVGQHVVEGVAKWEHIQAAVVADRKTLYQGMGHITDEHLNPKGKVAMKVKHAAQIFSHTVASHIENEHKYGCLKEDKSAMVTAFLVKFMDSLFDSVNGSGAIPYKGKTLRTRMTGSSSHLQFFKEAANVIRTWSFVGHTKSNSPPSQSGWLITLRAIQYVWIDLQKEGFYYLETRALNQDPLENFNGIVRANCGGNSNPTCRQYTGGFKTAIINNFAYADMNRTNCEFDNIELIDDLHALLYKENENSSADIEDDFQIDKFLKEVQEIIDDSVTTDSMKKAVEKGDRISRPVAHIAGFIAKRLLTNINCELCSQLLVTNILQPCHALIADKEYNKNKKSLTYPSVHLVECVGSCLTFIDEFLDKKAYLPKLKAAVTMALQKTFDFDWLSHGLCLQHTSIIPAHICNDAFFIAVKWWCTRQNRKFVEEQKKDHRKIKHFQGV